MSISIETETPIDFRESVSDGGFAYQKNKQIGNYILLEFIGTMSFVYISLAGVNQAVLSNPDNVNQLHIAICFAFGLTSGIIIADRSGGHLNPAITFITFITDPYFTFNQMLGYIIAQICGGVVAGLLVFSVYYSWINNAKDTSIYIGSFGTLKNSNNSLLCAIIDQFIGSAILMAAIIIIPKSNIKPCIIGSTLGCLGLFQGSNGFAFNLARDFGPRLASVLVFGLDAISAEDYWLLVPSIVPFFGVICGYYIGKFVLSLNAEFHL